MSKALRIIFYGTAEFAVPSLKILVENNINIIAVVTAPDKPAGRGQKINMSPVKEYALTQNLLVLQPEKLKSDEFQNKLKELNPNLQIVVAFRMMPESVWGFPELGTFNLHSSLLPQYRGAAPINWAIINGEKETGVTTFFLKHEIDTGDIVFQEKTSIGEDENVGSLYARLMEMGANLVLKTVKAIQEDNIKPIPQHIPDSWNHAPKIFKETCKIDWNKSAAEIHNFVRGLSPYPCAWTELNGKSLKIYATQKVAENQLKPTEISSDNKKYIHIGTGNGTISITELQAEGKKRMVVEEFLRGNKL
jgi:methionyl-tRNA formyltransferase